MGAVSLSEDIEELRQDNEHYQRGMDNLIRTLKSDVDLLEIQKVEKDLRKLADQLIKKYEDHKARAKSRFDEAIKYLNDPDVRITAKLEKRTRERDQARSALADRSTQLQACRESQARNLSRINELGKEKVALREDLQKLKDASYVKSALDGVEPLRRK
jgi:chromosome segregation ATPase